MYCAPLYSLISSTGTRSPRTMELEVAFLINTSSVLSLTTALGSENLEVLALKRRTLLPGDRERELVNHKL